MRSRRSLQGMTVQSWFYAAYLIPLMFGSAVSAGAASIDDLQKEFGATEAAYQAQIVKLSASRNLLAGAEAKANTRQAEVNTLRQAEAKALEHLHMLQKLSIEDPDYSPEPARKKHAAARRLLKKAEAGLAQLNEALARARGEMNQKQTHLSGLVQQRAQLNAALEQARFALLQKKIEREQTVEARGEASCGLGSIKECKSLALQEARRNAAEQGSAVLIDSLTVVKDFEASSDEIRSRVRAVVLRHEVLDQGFVGDSGYFYRIRAVVKGRLPKAAHIPAIPPAPPVYEQKKPVELSSAKSLKKTAVRQAQRTWVVDPAGKGDARNIAEAIRRADTGSRIVIRSGTYREALLLKKELHLESGGSDVSDVVIEVQGKSALRVATDAGSLRGITLRSQAKGSKPCVDIGRGRFVLRDNDISSGSGAALAVHYGAEPTVRGNRIHDSKGAGILVHDNGGGRFEDNDILSNALGIEVKSGSDPIVKNNRIHDSKGSGVFVHSKGKGRFENNDIYDNATEGMLVESTGHPVVAGNRIHHGQAGIVIQNKGKGRYEGNEIFGNAYYGISVRSGGDPEVIGNHVYDNSFGQITKLSGAKGQYRDNNTSP